MQIIDIKIVGICSKCRKLGDEIKKDNRGVPYPDSDIACIGCALGEEK